MPIYGLPTNGIEKHSKAEFIRIQMQRLGEVHLALSAHDQAFCDSLQNSFSTLKMKVEDLQNTRPQAWLLFQISLSDDDEQEFNRMRHRKLHLSYKRWLSKWKDRWDEVDFRKSFIDRLKIKLITRKATFEQNPHQVFQGRNDIFEEKFVNEDFAEEQKLSRLLNEILINEFNHGRNCIGSWQEVVTHLAQVRIKTYTDLLEKIDRIQLQVSELIGQLKPLDKEIETEMSQLLTADDACKLSFVTSNRGENLLHQAMREEKPIVANYLCKREPTFIFEADLSGKSPLQIALTGTHIGLQRMAFDTAIQAIEVDMAQISDDLPLVQQAGQLVKFLRDELKDYGNGFLKRKQWWTELLRDWPYLGQKIYDFLYPTTDINLRQEALIELLRCLNETINEFRLEEFNDKRTALAEIALQGWVKRSNLFDRLEKKLKVIACSHYLMRSFPNNLEKHQQNKDILIICDNDGVYKIYCVLIKSGQYQVDAPIVIDEGELKDNLDRVNQQRGFSNQRCQENTLIRLVNRIVTENGGYTQAAGLIEHPDFSQQRDEYINRRKQQQDELIEELAITKQELKQERAGREQERKRTDAVNQENLALKAELEALKRQNSQQQTDGKEATPEGSSNANNHFFKK